MLPDRRRIRRGGLCDACQERGICMTQWRLKLLYDGDCPFCRREVEWLKAKDKQGHLAFEDIGAIGFDPARYGLTRDAVTQVLHAVFPDGRVVRGVDAIREAYRAVGLGWLAARHVGRGYTGSPTAATPFSRHTAFRSAICWVATIATTAAAARRGMSEKGAVPRQSARFLGVRPGLSGIVPGSREEWNSIPKSCGYHHLWRCSQRDGEK